MKALVLGNGPNLPEEIKGVNLDGYFIVRMNGWKPINANTRCNAWSSWPDPTHREKYGRCEPMYDVEKYAENCGELWFVHPGFLELALKKFKREPDFVLSPRVLRNINIEVGSEPNMGMLMIQACLEQKRFSEVYVAGFDFYESGNDYYFTTGKFDHLAHHQPDNKRWFMEQINMGRIKRLK